MISISAVTISYWPLRGGHFGPSNARHWPDGDRPDSISPTTILDTPHIEANRPRRVPMMRETPKRYALSDSPSELDRAIPKE